ncbi:hypothetical protein L596_023530 [Steinernema carpocapsae]|uniref:Uncharacterized protein n=1 Tax=Steinernema carpocapsae TaxID=34508 RepID=A0A4U5MDZ2_STECR|nr:hypothetical protein L596_023530 [Steinernema carpocapsae]
MRFLSLFALSLVVLFSSSAALSDKQREEFALKLDSVLEQISDNGLSSWNKEQFNKLIDHAKEIGISKPFAEDRIYSKLPESTIANYLNNIVQRS